MKFGRFSSINQLDTYLHCLDRSQVGEEVEIAWYSLRGEARIFSPDHYNPDDVVLRSPHTSRHTIVGKFWATTSSSFHRLGQLKTIAYPILKFNKREYGTISLPLYAPQRYVMIPSQYVITGYEKDIHITRIFKSS